jgi:hypothetical protein
VHPDLYADLKFAMEAKTPNEWFQAAYSLTQATKRVQVMGSFFHAKSLLESMWSSTSPFYLIKEMTLATGDALLKTKNAAITKALDQFRNGGLGDSVDAWLKAGLDVSIPDDVTKGILPSLGKLGDEVISKYAPENHLLENSLSKVEKITLGITDHFTWNFLHTGLKLSVAEKYLGDMRRIHPSLDEAQARLEVSRFINNSYGGLNWYDVARQFENEFSRKLAMAALSPDGRKGLQLIQFAPDWTISTVRAFTTAMPKTIDITKWNPKEGVKGLLKPKNQADFARLYQLKTALTYLTLINAINYMTSGHSLFQNGDQTRIEFKDGTSMQVAKHAMEPYHWIADFDKTMANKLGFIPKAAIVEFGGVEYASPYAPKLIDQSQGSRAKSISKGLLPFQAQAAMQAPKGQGVERALESEFGFPRYGQTAGQRALKAQQDGREKKQIQMKRAQAKAERLK